MARSDTVVTMTHLSPQLDTALGRARMLLSLLNAPKLRSALGRRLSGSEGTADEVASTGPLSQLDWLTNNGSIDAGLLRDSVHAITLMRSPAAILEVGRLDALPTHPEERIQTSRRIVRMVADRMGSGRRFSEPELNAAIAMFSADTALVRRDAVDSGLLERATDGSWYRLAPSAEVPPHP